MSTVCEVVPQAQDVPDLIPARMLNEFAYCPRLAYLEWVQGEFADNLDVLEGRFGHRRVDHADRQDVPPPDEREDTDVETRRRGDAATEARPAPGSELPADAIHARSVMLSAPQAGLIAKLDLIDLQAGIAIPVDYKRGRVPDVPGGAWEPERVQLCAQGLILHENGYLCEGGILYYIESRRRVSVPFDEPLVERTRELLAQMREMAAARVMPPPLDDSPKCPRCSLVGICLPDETCLLKYEQALTRDTALTPCPSPGRRGENEVTPATTVGNGGVPAQRVGDVPNEVRRLMPARDDALPLYIQEQGVTLGKSGEVLTVKRRQEVIQSVKIKDVSQVSLLGNVQVTAQALREIAAAGIPLCHFSYGGWFFAMTTGLVHKNIELRMAQFRTAADPALSLRIARQIVLGKIRNGRTLLRRHLAEDEQGSGGEGEKGRGGDAEMERCGDQDQRPKTQDQKEKGRDAEVERRGDTEMDTGNGSAPRAETAPRCSAKTVTLRRLDDLAGKAEAAADLSSLLGLEGMAGKIYFEGFARLLHGDTAFDFESRNRRPPRDPVNALLSFVYAMLTKDLTLTLQAVGFDPMLGFYHQPRYGRPSLALDLVEEFRPIVADSVVLTLINNGEVSAGSFLRRGGGVVLTDAGRRTVISAYERRMDSLVTHPIFGYRICYRRVLEVQSRLLARAVLGELGDYPCFYTR